MGQVDMIVFMEAMLYTMPACTQKCFRGLLKKINEFLKSPYQFSIDKQGSVIGDRGDFSLSTDHTVTLKLTGRSSTLENIKRDLDDRYLEYVVYLYIFVSFNLQWK